MTRCKELSLSVLMSMCACASAQSGVDQGKGTSGSPVLREKIRRASAARDEGQALLKQGKLDQAIVSFRRAVAAEEVLRKDHGYFGSSSSYRLAKALTQAGRAEEALVAYRKAFWWSEKRQDLESNGPPFSDLGADYALLLAKAGKYEEAKAMYYWVMRQLVQVTGYERFPMVVVFEPDPTMSLWDNTPDKLLSAILMLRGLHGGISDEMRVRWADVQRREPTAIIAFVYVSWENSDFDWIHRAAALTATQDEKEWIGAFSEVLTASKFEQRKVEKEVMLRLEAIAAERRKNSTVLRKAKEDMAHMYKRLADGVLSVGDRSADQAAQEDADEYGVPRSGHPAHPRHRLGCSVGAGFEVTSIASDAGPALRFCGRGMRCALS